MAWTSLTERFGLGRFGLLKNANPETCVIATSLDYERATSPDHATLTDAQLDTAWRSPAILDQIGAAIEVRKRLTETMSQEELKRYVGHLQLRYRAAAGDAAYDRYAAGAPKTFSSREELLAEARTVLDRLRLVYSIVHFRDRYSSNIRGIFLTALVVEVIVMVSLLSSQALQLWLYNSILVALAGLLGSTVSILRRSHSIAAAATLADDPVVQVSALRYGYFGLYSGALSGAIFAMILALVLMSKLIDVPGLTPQFCPAKTAFCAKPLSQFSILQRDFTLASNIDAAKLLFLCFLSGFAEQLVPDVLDRFTGALSKP